MTPEQVKADYRRALKETVIIRRYTGTGPLATRPRFDVPARARVTGYAPAELVGNIQQGDRRAIVLVEDLIAKGLALPVTNNERCIEGGKECAIMAVDDKTIRVDGVLIALILQVRGA